ncbi:hypothetical protein PHET_12365, partial [Paragonimus heterotremus]
LGITYERIFEDLFPNSRRRFGPITPWNNNWDIYDGTVANSGESTPIPSEAGLTCPRTYQKLIVFVRHGQYNIKGRTPDEKRLTEIGWKQAYETGRQLKRLGIKSFSHLTLPLSNLPPKRDSFSAKRSLWTFIFLDGIIIRAMYRPKGNG